MRLIEMRLIKLSRHTHTIKHDYIFKLKINKLKKKIKYQKLKKKSTLSNTLRRAHFF